MFAMTIAVLTQLLYVKCTPVNTTTTYQVLTTNATTERGETIGKVFHDTNYQVNPT